MENFELGRKSLLGLITGLLLGIGLFFNLPSLSSFLGLASGLAIISGLIGFGVENFSNKAIGTLVLGLVLFVSFQAYTTSCFNNFVDRTHTPSENPLNGEVVTGEFEGFRLKLCDYGSHPWYFDNLNAEELAEFCENNSDIGYCETQKE